MACRILLNSIHNLLYRNGIPLDLFCFPNTNCSGVLSKFVLPLPLLRYLKSNHSFKNLVASSEMKISLETLVLVNWDLIWIRVGLVEKSISQFRIDIASKALIAPLA